MKKLLSNTLYPIITILEDEIDGSNTTNLDIVYAFCSNITDIFTSEDISSQKEFFASDLGSVFFELVEEKIVKSFEVSPETANENLKRFCHLVCSTSELSERDYGTFILNMTTYFNKFVTSEQSTPLTIDYLLKYPELKGIPLSAPIFVEDKLGNLSSVASIFDICWDAKTTFHCGVPSYERLFSIDTFFNPNSEFSTLSNKKLTFKTLKEFVEKYAVPKDTVVTLKDDVTEAPYEISVSDVYFMDEYAETYDELYVLLSKIED